MECLQVIISFALISYKNVQYLSLVEIYSRLFIAPIPVYFHYMCLTLTSIVAWIKLRDDSEPFLILVDLNLHWIQNIPLILVCALSTSIMRHQLTLKQIFCKHIGLHMSSFFSPSPLSRHQSLCLNVHVSISLPPSQLDKVKHTEWKALTSLCAFHQASASQCSSFAGASTHYLRAYISVLCVCACVCVSVRTIWIGRSISSPKGLSVHITPQIHNERRRDAS